MFFQQLFLGEKLYKIIGENIQNIFSFFFLNIGHTFCILYVNLRYFTRSQSLVKYKCFSTATLFKTFSDETVHIFSAKTNSHASQIYAFFFLTSRTAHKKSPTFNLAVCVTRICGPDMNRERGLAWSGQRIIFICYFPIFGCRLRKTAKIDIAIYRSLSIKRYSRIASHAKKLLLIRLILTAYIYVCT